MRGRLRVALGCFVLSNLSDAAFVCAKYATTCGSCYIAKKKHPRMVLFCCKIEDGCVDTRLTGCRVGVYAPSTRVVCLPLASARDKRAAPTESLRQPRPEAAGEPHVSKKEQP
jgi:hypothetical protein